MRVRCVSFTEIHAGLQISHHGEETFFVQCRNCTYCTETLRSIVHLEIVLWSTQEDVQKNLNIDFTYNKMNRNDVEFKMDIKHHRSIIIMVHVTCVLLYKVFRGNRPKFHQICIVVIG